MYGLDTPRPSCSAALERSPPQRFDQERKKKEEEKERERERVGRGVRGGSPSSLVRSVGWPREAPGPPHPKRYEKNFATP